MGCSTFIYFRFFFIHSSFPFANMYSRYSRHQWPNSNPMWNTKYNNNWQQVCAIQERVGCTVLLLMADFNLFAWACTASHIISGERSMIICIVVVVVTLLVFVFIRIQSSEIQWMKKKFKCNYMWSYMAISSYGSNLRENFSNASAQ